MKEGIEFKRLPYVKVFLYSGFYISLLLILVSAASTFGYKKFAPGFELASLLSGLIGTQVSNALLLLVRDLEGKEFKETLNFRWNLIIGLALSLSIVALLMWVFL